CSAKPSTSFDDEKGYQWLWAQSPDSFLLTDSWCGSEDVVFFSQFEVLLLIHD
ncbi:hypothetical protein AVEN_163265-1, partial [Araneus ventricosus]